MGNLSRMFSVEICLCSISGGCLNSMCWIGSRGEAAAASLSSLAPWLEFLLCSLGWGSGQRREHHGCLLWNKHSTPLCGGEDVGWGSIVLFKEGWPWAHTAQGTALSPTLSQLHPVIPSFKIPYLTCLVTAPCAHAIATKASSTLNFEKWGLWGCLVCAGQRNTFTASAEEGMQILIPCLKQWLVIFMSALQHVQSERPQ